MGNIAGRSGPDYDAVRKDIKDLMNEPEWDDGSYAPLLIRLGWHSSGTYNQSDNSGGSNGATMRFSPEKDDPENAGLEKGRELLEAIKKKHPGISYADLWILAAYVALEVTGGPVIEFNPGRIDKAKAAAIKPGRLPQAEYGLKKGLDEQGRIEGWENLAAHIRDVFGRMGFNDQEIVALICGGHVYGRCHPNLSGYAGAWVEKPTQFSNEFAADLIDDEWMYVEHDTKVEGEPIPEETRPAPGKRQYMTKWAPSALEIIDNANAAQYPPGRYKVSVGWINVRRTHQPDSMVIDQPERGKEFNVVSCRVFGKGVRGQLDVGGWASIISTSGDEVLMTRVGDLNIVPAKYRVLSGAINNAKIYDRPPGSIADIGNMDSVGTLQEREVLLDDFVIFEDTDKSVVIFGKIGDGSAKGKYVPVVLTDIGAIFERIEPGYNDTPRKGIRRMQVKYQMMLPSDMVLLWDSGFREHLEKYAQNENALKKDFGVAYQKLTELGFKPCPAMK